MRLVNADELMEHVWRDKLDSRELIAEMIDNAPTVKEIPTKIPIGVFERLLSMSCESEIIECKDCKYRGETSIASGRYWCNLHGSFMYYCSDAERRKENDSN